MKFLTHVNVLDEPDLYEVASSSPTHFYVDSRNPEAPRYMRWHGTGDPITSYMDNRWHDLTVLISEPRKIDVQPGLIMPLDTEDIVAWTLRVGCGHTYYTLREEDHPNGPVYWVFGPTAERITLLDIEPPPVGRVVALVAVAVPYDLAWAAFVPDMPGLEVRVTRLDNAAEAIAAKAAALTDRDPDDFVVSVQYVPPTLAEGDPS